MKYINKYTEMGILSEDLVFKYLISNLKETIYTYDFFVAWGKIIGNITKIEVALNILNTIIGKESIENSLKDLIKDYPEIVPIFPLLIAVRSKNIKISDMHGDITYSFDSLKNYTDDEINKIIYFVKECGLLKILSDRKIKNLVDYAIGVEVGLDTNARKNRSGSLMENLIEIYIKLICQKYNYKYIQQATALNINKQFSKDINIDKTDRHFDFAIDTGDILYLIEVNYYSGGGSKLKSVAGEFSKLFNLVKDDKVKFIWITDGKGWLTAQRPLKETFDITDYIINIDMINHGILEEILIKGL